MTSEKAAQRRAVRQAIRTGHAPDAKIDALARRRADQAVRQSVVVKIYAVILALQLGLLVFRIATGGPLGPLWLTVFADVLWATGVVVLAVNLSRSRRYLRENPETRP